jgi:DNA polymerase-3 subunit delta'
MPFSDVIGHERPKAMLQAALRQNRVGHAYLFHGETAIGKRLTALRFAQAVNCETTEAVNGQDACGHCRSCHQLDAGIHPDFVLITPDPELSNPQIKIEEIRALEEQMVYRPLVAQRRVVLIDEADRMTLGAANALLKTLEEPPGYSMLILVTSRPYSLPVTIRSRCQPVRFAAPGQAQVEALLAARRSLSGTDARFLAALTQNRLGEALETDLASAREKQRQFAGILAPSSLQSVGSVLSVAEALCREDRGPEALEWLARWIRDLILVRMGAEQASLVNIDRVSALQEAARSADTDCLLALMDDIEGFQRAAHRNLNLQLALESIMLRLRDALFPPAGAVRT